jgi:hypothetical protein
MDLFQSLQSIVLLYVGMRLVKLAKMLYRFNKSRLPLPSGFTFLELCNCAICICICNFAFAILHLQFHLLP